MKKTIILCLSILMIAFTGCKKNKNSWGKLAETGITVKIGQTQQLTFTSDGNVKPQWVSDDETIATVDENGVVTGVRVGSTNVTVNGLICTVTVIDDFMYAVEPMQNWMAEKDDVLAYMTVYFDNTVIPLETNDTAYVIDTIVSYNDSVYNPDSMRYDYFVVNDTLYDTIPYVATVTYEYEVELKNQFANKYVYNFEFDEEDRTAYLRSATMTAIPAHQKDVDTFLNNRYLKEKTGGYKAVNEWYYYSYIMGDTPDIIYSAYQFTDK